MRQKQLKSRLKRFKLFTIKEEKEYTTRRPSYVFDVKVPETTPTPNCSPRIEVEVENKIRCVIL